MHYRNLINVLTKEFATTPLFNKIKIKALLDEISYAKNQEIASIKITEFCTNLLAIVDVMLTIDHTEFQKVRSDKQPATQQQTAKKIAEKLNAGKLAKRDGTVIKINVDNYLKIQDFKKNNSIDALKPLVKIKMNMENILNFLTTHPLTSNLAIAYNTTMVPPLMNEKDKIIDSMVEARSAIKRFDKEIGKLYQASSSLIFEIHQVTIIAPSPMMRGAAELNAQLKACFPYKPAVYLAGNYPDNYSISKQMQAVYMSALNAINEFNLELSEAEESVYSPEIIQAKQKIMATFNNHLNAIFSRPAISPVKALLKDNPTSKLDVVQIDTMPEEKPDPTPLSLDLLILAREVTEEELFHCESIHITLKKDNEALLQEADLAYSIVEVYNYLQVVRQVFNDSPHHLRAESSAINKTDLDQYIKQLTESVAKVTTALNVYATSLGDDLYDLQHDPKFIETNCQLIAITSELKQLTLDLAVADDAPASLKELREQIISADAKISDAAQRIEHLQANHPEKLYRMKKLTFTVNSLVDNIKPLRGIIATLQQHYASLAASFKDRKTQVLLEITTAIELSKRKLEVLEKGSSAFVMPLKYPLAEQLAADCHGLENEISTFNESLAQIRNNIETQRILIANAELTRRRQLGIAGNRNILFSPLSDHAITEGATPVNPQPAYRGGS